MKPEIVHAALGNAHLYAGEVIRRVVAFNLKHELPALPEHVFGELASQMLQDPPHTLVQVMLNSEDMPIGHGVTHIQELYGYRTAMIYQLEIDPEWKEGREDALKAGLDQIMTFAENERCKAVRAWAMNKKLVQIFGRFDFKPKEYVFIEREL